LDGLTRNVTYDWPGEPNESPWGYTTMWGLPIEPEDDELEVTRVVFTFAATEAGADRELLQRLGTAAPAWFDSVRDWCEVLHEQDLDYRAPRRRPELGGFGWESWYLGEPERSPTRMSFYYERGQRMTCVAWQEVVALVSNGAQPPTSSLLMRDARNARDRGQHRAALIDAATALEMALFGIAEEAHRAGTTSMTDKTLDHLRTRGSLSDLFKHLSDPEALPSNFDDGLIGLRNAVVHKSARVPTKDEVNAMVEAAIAMAEVAWPGWPRLG
jgi:hypothetical protein